MLKNLVIVGGGGQANVIVDAVDKASYTNIFIEDPFICENTRYGIDVINDSSNYQPSSLEFVIAIGDNYKRSLILQSLNNRFHNPKCATIIHPNANVSERAKIGAGTVICSGAFVGPETKVGSHVILNTNCSVDHDCVINDFSSIGPNATLGGNVTIGVRTTISISATISHGVEIGDDNVIGAGSLVLEKISTNNSVWLGTPAHLHRKRKKNERYL
ncbi:acetyltransferase [Alphaproteobacteria bacterium]|nr:acetyltransferase [Alphaproteobacteria bacterium]